MELPHIPRRMPDPARAHGAWVYLVVSILAGALTSIGQGFLPALLAGIGYAGVFLTASAAALGRGRWHRRFAIGATLALVPPGLALLLGADPAFLAYAPIAAFPAGASGWFAIQRGFQSPLALAFAVAALALAAPSAACAGGTSHTLGWILLGLLVPFFVWRSWRLSVLMKAEKGWTKKRLRRIGLTEAGLAVAWTALALAVVHAIARTGAA
jgi:hypothetical protein